METTAVDRLVSLEAIRHAGRRSGRRVAALLPSLSVWVLVLAVTTAPGLSQTSRADRPTSPIFSARATRVLLDVVVRDRKGRLVVDLGAADFEVREDGVRQIVDSFRVVSQDPKMPVHANVPRATLPRTSDGAQEAPGLGTTPAAGSVIAFVFDSMSAGGRDMAHKAALAFADGRHLDGDQTAVFVIEGGLRIVEPFTRDIDRVRAAFDRALTHGNATTPIDRARTRDLVDVIDRAQVGLTKEGAGTGLKETIGATAARSASNQVEVTMNRTFETLERDAGGQSAMNALLAVVNGLGQIPGRKTLILFSEGLQVPAGARAPFRSVIAAANRANVSVYAMDAGGLRAESETAETGREIEQASLRRMRQLNEGLGDAPDGDMMRVLERNEDLLRLNPRSGLGELAESTGGFLVPGTNDAEAALARIAEDMRSYYLLSYSPSNDAYDGKFRSIEVKVRRPGVHVQAREGYFAVRPSDAAPALAFEAPALAALDTEPKPASFPLGVSALAFPEPARHGLVAVVVDTPLDAASCAPIHEEGSRGETRAECTVDFSVVVRIHDAQHTEAGRMSQHYRFRAPLAKPKDGRPGRIRFYREIDLDPGRYTVEAAAYDALARRASVRTADVAVRGVAEDRLRISSIVLVTQADHVADEEASAQVLRFGDALLYPSTGEPWSKASVPSLPFFVTIYGAGRSPATATIELRRSDQLLQSTTAELRGPDAMGRIQYAGALPLTPLTPGDYTLSVTAADARGADTRATEFTVVP